MAQELQRAGAKRLPAADFLRGISWRSATDSAVIEIQLRAARVVLEVLDGRSLTPALAQARSSEPDDSWGMLQNIAFGVFRQLGLLRAHIDGSGG
jgi:hypothetical protein